MAWPTTTVQDWKHFLHVASQVAVSRERRRYTFRGQAKSEWGLRTSLRRHLGATADVQTAVAVEKEIFRRFATFTPLHFPQTSYPTIKKASAWWPLMQHYNAPTRLLDWTSSVYVAADFAVEREWESDGAVGCSDLRL